MTKVTINGLVFVFEDDTKLIDWLDANCDDMHEEGRDNEQQ